MIYRNQNNITDSKLQNNSRKGQTFLFAAIYCEENENINTKQYRI